jgi:hypothetical protein
MPCSFQSTTHSFTYLSLHAEMIEKISKAKEQDELFDEILNEVFTTLMNCL